MIFDIYSLYSFGCFILPGSVWLFLNREKIARKRYRWRHVAWSYVYMLYCYLAVQKVAELGPSGILSVMENWMQPSICSRFHLKVLQPIF